MRSRARSMAPYGAARAAAIVLSRLENFKPHRRFRPAILRAMTAAAAVRLAPRDAPGLRRAVRLCHLAAVVCAFLACGLTPPAWLLAGALALHLCVFEDERRQLVAEVLAVLFDSGGVWQVQWRDGSREIVRPCAARLVSPWLTVLAFDTRRGRITLYVTRATLDPASFRRLRLRLLWQASVPS